MRAKWTVALSAGLALLLGGAGGAAFAESPVELGSGYVYDGSDVLTPSEESAANDRLAALADKTDVRLWVVYVDDFENPSDRVAWADATAEQNGLGQNQYLLAIATEGRQLYISSPPDGSVSNSRLDAIEQDVIDSLGNDDWSAAVDAAADGFEGDGSNGAVWAGVVALVVVAGIVVAVVLLRSRKKNASRTAAEPEVPIEDLQRRAASLLIATDDGVRTSEQELGFAIAQFGEEATKEFRDALGRAKENLSQAFELKQRLDDGEKDTPEEVRAWTTEIIRLCEESERMLAEKAEAFEQLRGLEQNAPEALARAQESRAQAAGLADGATRALAELSSRYAQEALAPVADNPQQIGARLALADEQLAAAQQAVGAGRSGEAAVAIRNAEQAVAQASALASAVSELGASLADGERRAAELIAELEGDVAAARALPDADGRIAAAVARTEQQLAQAKHNLADAGRRPLLMLEALQKADAEIDQAVAGGRDAAERASRAAQVLDQTLLQARAQVNAAEEYVSVRRGGVGADARTRLAQAGAELARAEGLRAGDPAQALSHAQAALQLAQHAMSLAQNDLGGMGSPYRGSSGSSDFGAALLGSLLGNALSGGGRSSGWGGWSGGGSAGRRSPSGGISFGGGGRSGRSGGGSFGGGGRSGRRGGGRF